MTTLDQIRTWVEVVGFSNQSVILLQMEKLNHKPSSPFKFNDTWLEEEYYKELIENEWIRYDPNQGE